MNIIIVCDGKVGAAMAEKLSREDHNFTNIHSKPQVLN